MPIQRTADESDRIKKEQATLALRESIKYYSRIGYPQYAGRYVVPNLPPGAVVRSVSEQGEYGRKTLFFEVEEQRKTPPSRMVPDNAEGLLGFGLSTEFWNPSTGERHIQQGSDVASAIADAKNVSTSKYYAKLMPAGSGVQQDPFEQRLTSGVLNFQVAAALVIAPKLIPFATGGVAVAESVKYGVTGQHLTVEEAFAAAGIGELAGVGVMTGASQINNRYIKPRVSDSLTNDYITQQRVNENILLGKVVDKTKVWTPTATQRFQMKVTGAQPKSLASGLSSFGSAQDVAYGMRMMEAESASFDLGFSPRASFIGINKGPALSRAPAMPSKLPVFFGLGTDIFEQVHDGPSQSIWEKPEKNLTESQLAYDYKGPLSFDKYPIKIEYSKGKHVSSAWKPPFQESPAGSKAGMKPLWNSVGSKSAILEPEARIASYGEGYSVALKTSQRASATSFSPFSGVQKLIQTEDQFLSYPQTGLATPAFLGPKTITRNDLKPRQGTFYRTMPSLINMQTPKMSPSLSFVAKQTQPQLTREVLSQTLRYTIPEPQIPSMVQRTTQTHTFSFPVAPKSFSKFTAPGSKMEGRGYSGSSLRRLLGLQSRKKKYPILSAKQFLVAEFKNTRRRR